MRWLKLIRLAPMVPLAYIQGKKETSQQESYKQCHIWSKRILKGLGYRLKVEGFENLKEKEGLYFVCNHQGTLDPVLIVAAFNQPIRFVSKLENADIPLLGMWAKKIGCIHFDRNSREGNISMLRQTMRALKRKENVLIFPEGTRSKKDEMNPFMDKALQPAIKTKSNIVPISISHSYVLDNYIYKGKDLKIVFGEAITPETYKDMNLEELSSSIQTWISSKIEKCM